MDGCFDCQKYFFFPVYKMYRGRQSFCHANGHKWPLLSSCCL